MIQVEELQHVIQQLREDDARKRQTINRLQQQVDSHSRSLPPPQQPPPLSSQVSEVILSPLLPIIVRVSTVLGAFISVSGPPWCEEGKERRHSQAQKTLQGDSDRLIEVY